MSRLDGRLRRLEAAAVERLQRRWDAGVDQLRRTMEPDHARFVAAWLREHVDGKRTGPCVDDAAHACPRCLGRLRPPALARAAWYMLLDHVLESGAPVALPPAVAAIYLEDPDAHPANACPGCGYLLPTRSTARRDGTYHHRALYDIRCPCCGRRPRDGADSPGLSGLPWLRSEDAHTREATFSIIGPARQTGAAGRM